MHDKTEAAWATLCDVYGERDLFRALLAMRGNFEDMKGTEGLGDFASSLERMAHGLEAVLVARGYVPENLVRSVLVAADAGHLVPATPRAELPDA